ncbi:MAG TPA: VCBS repeat-containing protein [Blastocatellia bacterium]|nr:VCBS repeat-containing protein [Blastocatellia bacterium]
MRTSVFIAISFFALLPVGAVAQTSAPIKVSAEFQSDVAQLAARGLRLKEAVEASLEANARHLAAIFEQAKPKGLSESFEFRIIEFDGRARKTIFRRAEFFFSFSGAGELARLNATDINGDGLKEIILQSSSGGNCWSCNPIEIYRVRNSKVELVAAAPIQRIVDLNGDGSMELVVADSRWENYGDLSHAAAPFALVVYSWRNGQYVYAARDFAAFYRGEADRLRAAIAEARAEITADEFSDEVYVGRAMALAITYAHAGEIDRGLRELEALLGSDARSPAQAKRRQAILEDFRNGESAKKLRQMKYGEPIS